MKQAIKLWPLLGLYLVVVLSFASDAFQGDESRYAAYAENLSHGFHAAQTASSFWNGPGYPLLLVPFAAFHVPWLAAKLLNAVLLYGAGLLFLQTLKAYLPERKAFWTAVLFGLYPPFWRELHLLLSETFTYFLVCGFLCSFCWLHQGGTKRFALVAAYRFFRLLRPTTD